jgi:hypothetical protein
VYFYIGGLRKIYLPTDYLPTILPTALVIKLNNNENLNFKILESVFGKVIKENDYSNRECYGYYINEDNTRDNYIKNDAQNDAQLAQLIDTRYLFQGSLYKISYSTITFV